MNDNHYNTNYCDKYKLVKIMSFKLLEKCLDSKKAEFYYGAKINKQIKDVYLGIGFLEPKEENRKIGPGRGHEEILYLQAGKIEVIIENNPLILNEGELLYIPDKSKVILKNLAENKSQFIIAGGHVKQHKH